MESTAEFNPTKIWHVEFSLARLSRCLFRMLAHMKTDVCKLIISLLLLLVNQKQSELSLIKTKLDINQELTLKFNVSSHAFSENPVSTH